ncbi:MAG: hypothetical protein ACF8PN_04380 [Phycisphaerales bacterium]
MRASQIVAILFLGGLFAAAGCATTGADPRSSAAGPVYDWENRLTLSVDQSRLLHLYHDLDDYPEGSMERRQVERTIEKARDALGARAVAPAPPGVVIVFREDERSTRFYNPTNENLAFTVHVEGDEEWMGSARGQIGRDAWLPPGGSLVVENVVWVSPRMATRPDDDP